MKTSEITDKIMQLKVFLNNRAFDHIVLQNYNCEFQVQLDEMLARFKQHYNE